jgi:N-acetylneuraminate epimerase
MRWVGLLLAAMSMASQAEVLQWKEFPAIPDAEGFAGMYAGVSNGVLLAAGGANFPDKKPWEGGQKIWYDTVWMLAAPDGEWQQVATLPSARGYGVSVSTVDGLLCIGGAEAEQHTSECLLLSWNRAVLKQSKMPPLPAPCANLTGALVGNIVYVAGGISSPSSTNALSSFWALDLDDLRSGWKSLPPCPGPPRMLAVAATGQDAFYYLSGTSLAAGSDGKASRTYLLDAWKFAPGAGWERLPDLPRAAVAAPSPAPWIGGQIWVLGGDDGKLVDFEPIAQHPGFPRTPLRFDVSKAVWMEGAPMKASLVTNPVTPWQGWHVMVSGEQRPGVRSAAVWGVR